MAVELAKERRLTALASIERWFSVHLDQNIGNMQAAELLDFFLKELAPMAYNRGVADAQAQMLARVNEVDIDCHESEFGYWTAGRRRGTEAGTQSARQANRCKRTLLQRRHPIRADRGATMLRGFPSSAARQRSLLRWAFEHLRDHRASEAAGQ